MRRFAAFSALDDEGRPPLASSPSNSQRSAGRPQRLFSIFAMIAFREEKQ